ncbi:unnamed protein product [Acanthoscelides obtectus]|uniref:Uncharacterized protein n=1 Tax=Acanthoscelides obtectus TaxID=200917 RepID=A0A9P0KW07_ACAOB|nr:unnamed protein product [Acanthoscelides obtectus]CAK1628533.1 hypothetical protein AOBTE_LOCUS5259 [Acanthoscelides obtectus]
MEKNRALLIHDSKYTMDILKNNDSIQSDVDFLETFLLRPFHYLQQHHSCGANKYEHHKRSEMRFIIGKNYQYNKPDNRNMFPKWLQSMKGLRYDNQITDMLPPGTADDPDCLLMKPRPPDPH